MVRFSFTVLLACALALQIAAAPHVQAAPYTPPDISVQIDAYLNRAAMAGSFSGSVLVARRGHILLDKGYGQADRAARIPDTPQTRYLLASVSKQFTAMAILLLQKEGKLNVRDRICNYLATCPRTWRAITIHELLAHTSGIPDYMSFADFDAGMNTAITPAELVDRFRYLPLDFAPGTSWRYSNSGYALLGYIIERVSGQSYSDFLQRRIFHPLRMSATAYEPDGVIGEGTAVGYDGQSKADAMNPTVAYAAGGLVSTMAESMGIFAPNANSYRRFRRNSYAPISPCWGVNNRSVSVRVPAGAPPTRHIEHRVAGADANPYLAAATTLAAVHHGITRKLDPGKPVAGNGYAEAKSDLPTNWYAAMDATEGSAFLKDYLGERFMDIYCAIKRAEQDRFYSQVTALDLEWYLRTA